jgi:hypothetical protein
MWTAFISCARLRLLSNEWEFVASVRVRSGHVQAGPVSCPLMTTEKTKTASNIKTPLLINLLIIYLFIYDLFKNTASTSECVTLHERILMHKEVERMWQILIG